MKRAPSKKAQRYSPSEDAGLNAILIIDQQPVRKKVLVRLKTAQNKLLKAKHDLNHHLTVVRPDYHSWVASITKDKHESIGKLSRQIEERERMLLRIEQLHFGRGIPPGKAYKMAFKEFEEEQLKMDFNDPFDHEPKFGFNHEQEQEKENSYEDDFFERFQRARRSRRHETNRPFHLRKETAFERMQKLEKEQKLRTLYRQIARILHPDTGMESSKSSRELWSDVVDAYKARDLDKLEMLWISIQLIADSNSSSIGLSDLNQFIGFLAGQTRKIKQEMMVYTMNDPSWDFQAKDRNQLSKTILSSLSKTERALKRTLREIEADLKDFEEYSLRARTLSPQWSRF